MNQAADARQQGRQQQGRAGGGGVAEAEGGGGEEPHVHGTGAGHMLQHGVHVGFVQLAQ